MSPQKIPDDWQEKIKMHVSELGMSVRTKNRLEENGIPTVQDLLNCTRDRLLAISNFGDTALAEVYRALATIGFHRG